ncbi:MAG: tRNA (adenosine(37)-N6)-threonylcarbamoyltransferase complex dimerization subunit type 1 TsaB [Mycoplasmataceae bacterium]|jgi:tRNA threonylcarbamoyl adenosine modification protein YeaZ|nr:tRNA (adenosine(37)-N6)-threonylcarbamoyltransferase complex dimerization subunit type 1 TsaB [Mycoplasmataceae bacterium]
MFSLFIDTTQSYCNLAILKDKNIITKRSIKTNNNLTDIVIEHIDTLIQKSKLTHNDINQIFVVIGPGSFTGVRVGVLIAKTWTLIHKTPIYTINSLLFQLKNGTGLSILDARGELFYVAAYKNYKCILKPQIITNDKATTLIKKYKTNVFIGFKNINVFDNLISNLTKFKYTKDINKLSPLYIKNPV